MCHVLVIEDEALVAMMIEDCLRNAGATSFDFAATEDEAVELALLSPPGFITADVTLARGKGPSAVNRIRARLGPVPAVVISGDLHPQCPEPPPCRVLKKPFLDEQITTIFRELAPV